MSNQSDRWHGRRSSWFETIYRRPFTFVRDLFSSSTPSFPSPPLRVVPLHTPFRLPTQIERNMIKTRLEPRCPIQLPQYGPRLDQTNDYEHFRYAPSDDEVDLDTRISRPTVRVRDHEPSGRISSYLAQIEQLNSITFRRKAAKRDEPTDEFTSNWARAGVTSRKRGEKRMESMTTESNTRRQSPPAKRPTIVLDVITLDDDDEEEPPSVRQVPDSTITLPSTASNTTAELPEVEIVEVKRSDKFAVEPENLDVKPLIDCGYYRGPFNKRMIVLDQDEPSDDDRDFEDGGRFSPLTSPPPELN